MLNLKNLFRPPETKASRTAQVLAFESGGRARWSPRDYAGLAREGYLANAIVHRSVRLIAENAASCAFLLYEGAQERDDHPLLRLITRPNARQDGASFFEALYAHMLLAGNAYVEAVALDGEVRELYALRPDRMKVVPGSDGWAEAYDYSVGGRSVRFDQAGTGVPPILHLTFFHPLDDHYGLAPIEAAAVAVDAAVQIGVLDTALTAPPSSPAEGARYIVATGATGDWAGHDNAIAALEDGAWRFLMPKLGWCAWSAADQVMFVFDGAAWRDLRDLPVALADTSSVGVNAAAEAPNLLTVHSNAALLYAIATADGGSGDARLQISKEDTASTASVVFSDSFSGRAEFGLVESNAFKLKVSDDGVSFTEALVIDQATGNATLPRGVVLTGVIAPPQLTADEDDYAPSGNAAASVMRLSADAVRSMTGLADGAEGRVLCLINTGPFAVILRDENASSSAANRFGFGSDLTLGAKQGALLIYDGNAARWRRIGEPSASGGGGVTDAERQNALLALVYQSKARAEYRRLVNLFTTGFKGASDAANGIDAGSANYAVNTTAGAVGPTAVTMLLPMDGTNGATTFTDSGPNAHSISASGVAITTSASKFGGASGSFAGTGGLSFTDNLSDLTFAGDFTVAFWMCTTTTSTDTSFRRMFSFNLDSATTLQAYVDGSGFVVVRNSGTLLQGATSVADGSWHHVEISRVGTTLQLFVDGNQEASATNSTVFAAGSIARIGSYNGTQGRYVGYLDDFVVYNGIGLHSSNFTLPSAAAYAADSMTLVTASQTADFSVSNGRVLLEYDNAASPALNTDLTVEVTCDGGTNWTSATLSSVTSNSQDGRSVAETADTACTSGTSFAARIKTANGRDVRVYGLSLVVH